MLLPTENWSLTQEWIPTDKYFSSFGLILIVELYIFYCSFSSQGQILQYVFALVNQAGWKILERTVFC